MGCLDPLLATVMAGTDLAILGLVLPLQLSCRGLDLGFYVLGRCGNAETPLSVPLSAV